MSLESRKNNFNIMRFVAAMMVILGHMSFILGVDVKVFLGQAVSTIAVKILLLISGYLIAQSFMHDSNIIRYFIRRLFRIIPGLVGVVLISILVIGPIFTVLPLKEYFSHSMTWQYMRNILFYVQYSLPGVFETNPYPNAVNGSLWTIPVEISLYIMLVILFLIFRRWDITKISIIIGSALEIINISIRYIRPSAVWCVYGTDLVAALAIIPYFFVGIFFTSKKIKKYLNLQLATAVLCIAQMMNIGGKKAEIMIFFVLPYFVFSFGLAEKPLFSKCFSKNDFSYGIYLYGFVVQQMTITVLSEYTLSLNVYFVICAFLTFIFAMMSWFLIEKPTQNLSKKILHTDRIMRLKKIDIGQYE